MERNILKVKYLLFLVFLTNGAYSETEITTVASIETVSSDLDDIAEQNAWEVLNKTITDLDSLKILYYNISGEYFKRVESVPKPIKDVVKAVNSFKGIVSIRATLNSFFPAFWKISKRRQCRKLLDEKIQAFDKELDKELESTYDVHMKEIKENLSRTFDRLNSMINSLKLNYDTFLRNCIKDDRNCDMAPNMYIVNDNLQNIKLDLDFTDKVFKNLSQAWIHDYVYEKLIPSIKGCMDS